MAATRTEQSQTLRKVYLSAFEIRDVKRVLFMRTKDVRCDAERRANCYRACDWLETLIAGKSLLAEIEVVGKHWVLEGIGKACIADGLGDVGADILNQITGGGD